MALTLGLNTTADDRMFKFLYEELKWWIESQEYKDFYTYGAWCTNIVNDRSWW